MEHVQLVRGFDSKYPMFRVAGRIHAVENHLSAGRWPSHCDLLDLTSRLLEEELEHHPREYC